MITFRTLRYAVLILVLAALAPATITEAYDGARRGNATVRPASANYLELRTVGHHHSHGHHHHKKHHHSRGHHYYYVPVYPGHKYHHHYHHGPYRYKCHPYPYYPRGYVIGVPQFYFHFSF
jgi:hypothetical protein